MSPEVIRLAGGVFIALCGLLAGQTASERLRSRTELIGEFVSFLTQVQCVIGYTANEACSLLENISGLRRMDPVIREALRLLNSGGSFEDAWKAAVGRCVSCREDRELMLAFGNSFGTSNISGELSKTGLLKERASRYHSELIEEYRTKRRLYRTTGTFFGVMAAVVMV